MHTALCDRTAMSIKCPFTITHLTIGQYKYAVIRQDRQRTYV